MFDTPLPVPESTEYARLGVAPDATQEEILAAVGHAERRLASEQLAVQRQLQDVYNQVDGLRDVYRERDDVLATDADADRLQQVSERLSKLEPKAVAVNPRFTTLRDRLKSIEDQLRQLSATVLYRTDSRAEYDQEHPPLALLKVEDGTRDTFATDARVALTLLRRETAAFLTRQGETVRHTSDVTRRDFSSDFTYVQLLDGQS